MADVRKIFAQVVFPEYRPKLKENTRELTELAFKYLYTLNKSSRILNDSKALTALNFLLAHSGSTEETISLGIIL